MTPVMAECGATIGAVLFDLVGTLVEPAASVGTQYGECALTYGLRADPERLNLSFHSVMAETRAPVWPGLPEAEVAVQERLHWRRLVGEVFGRAGYGAAWKPGAFDECFDELFRRFATARGWTVYADALPALERIRSSGVRIGLVTNFDLRVRPLLESLDIARYFDVVVVPGLTGCSKPDPRLFARALKDLGVTPSQAVHVGDSVDEDVEGARRASLRAVLVDRADRHPELDGVPGVDRIATLDQLWV